MKDREFILILGVIIGLCAVIVYGEHWLRVRDSRPSIPVPAEVSR